MELHDLIRSLGLDPDALTGGTLVVRSPVDGTEIARLHENTEADAAAAIERASNAFLNWRTVPGPRRGELVRLFGEELRAHKAELGRLVSIEAGKILQEGLGEVQEMIDICDFAVGLSRQLYGLTIASERPGHRMAETWHPLGPVGVISAFNFPVAVWSWNAALALVCGDPVIWKPSEKTPVTALATMAIFRKAAERFGGVPDGLAEILIGGRAIGETLVDSPKVPLISATGSTRMGREVGPRVAQRLGRSLLELGGNNAMIVCPSADLDMAVRAILFGAVGTAGQRCTTLRRLFVHESVYDKLVPALKQAYGAVSIGSPLEQGKLVGPLIDKASFDGMQTALAAARDQGGTVTGGVQVTAGVPAGGFYVSPAIVEMPAQSDIVKHETFAPILYVMKYREFGQALMQHNDVPQGLSSCIFTTDMREAETFLSAAGSDCGIANVNIGTSGAEIGGAFGGEKETGGGRESGSDAWKAYMRRQTATVNYSRELPLAQGIVFDLG
ncbi:L-piperidine-6-carboxylate dehydrogenase [Inquilinus limosus]|uniref:aldehyde dehydrogenase (NAD(+)) n=1 Tax=Inquilinus limosus TaxID=171674 RepID=A0A211ZPB3_9PROT|nr:aldehyde dehydrogenase family protein [Inquilinus limosus]OWJ67026.1 aldehyde dehydrogenase family protein [Inquilinus limosus]